MKYLPFVDFSNEIFAMPNKIQLSRLNEIMLLLGVFVTVILIFFLHV